MVGLSSILTDPASTAVAAAASKPDPPDVLDRQKCLDALAALRHAKWFQVRYYPTPYTLCSLMLNMASCGYLLYIVTFS